MLRKGLAETSDTNPFKTAYNKKKYGIQKFYIVHIHDGNMP